MTDKLLDRYLELRAVLYIQKDDEVTIVAEQHIHITTGSIIELNKVLEEFPDTILHSTDGRLCVWRYD